MASTSGFLRQRLALRSASARLSAHSAWLQAATPSDRSTICARSSRVNADDQWPRRLDLFAPRPQQVHEFDLAQGRLGVGPSSLDVRRSRLAQNEEPGRAGR
jgi:hypothetical protein